MTELASPPSFSSLSSLRRYLLVLRRQWWILALVTLLAILAAGLYVSSKPSVYASQMKVVVGQGQALFVPDVSNAVQPFTQTMTDLIQSNVVARETIDRLGLDMTPTQLIGQLSVTTRPDASVLQVQYQDTDRVRGLAILRTVGQVFSQLVDQQLGGGTGATTGNGSNGNNAGSRPVSATVFDPAHLVPGRVAPKPKRTIAIAIVLGLIAGTLLAFLRDALTSRIRSIDEAQDALGAAVIGVLPPGSVGVTPAQLPLLPHKTSARMREALQVLAATLRFASRQSESGVIVVTSAEPEEGKSTVAAHVSSFLAGGGRSVVLVDADLRRPALHRFFGNDPGAAGLADVLTGAARLSDVLIVPEMTVRDAPLTAIRGLHTTVREPRSIDADMETPQLVMAGTPNRNPSQLLSFAAAAELVAQLRKVADYVVIDTAPLLVSGDGFPLVQLADSVVVVSREGSSTREQARQLHDRLSALGVEDFSVVLTEASSASRMPYGYDG